MLRVTCLRVSIVRTIFFRSGGSIAVARSCFGVPMSNILDINTTRLREQRLISGSSSLKKSS